MENRRRIEGWLPNVLIQHIQSFMSVKEAVQTSILSKSWHNAWSTRPDLNFDQRDFDTSGIFWEFANNTLQRYETMNLKIVSFRLWVYTTILDYGYLAKQAIVKAMKMGAVDFKFEIDSMHEEFILPREVLGSENIVRLCVDKCTIDVSKVSCTKLETLILSGMRVKGEIFRDLISSCPLIENVKLVTIWSSQGSRPYTFGPSNVHEWYRVRSLHLGDVIVVDPLFFGDMLSNFPCLKDLTLVGWTCDKSVRLSSRSLECLSFQHACLLSAEIDVPNIRKFKYQSSFLIPSSWVFKKTSREWESDIRVGCRSACTAWFLELKKLLTCLNLSKIYLTVAVRSIEKKSVDFQGLPETPVENLMIYAPPSLWFTVIEYLFRSCRPKFITLHILLAPDSGTRRKQRKVKNDFLEIVSKRNVEGVRESCLMMNHDLEEVDIQLFEEGVVERQPLPQKIHFRLRWRA